MALKLKNLYNVLATPTEVFQDVKTDPRWIHVLFTVSVATIAVALFTFPFSTQIAKLTMPSSLDPEKMQQAVELGQKFQYVGLLFMPVVMLIKWSIFSATMYYSAILFNAQELKYKQVFSVVAYSEIILILMALINILLVYIKDVSSITHAIDLNAVIGLGFFLSNKYTSIPLYTFLNSVNVFSIWYLITLIIGINVVSGLSKSKSSVIVISAWLLGVGFQVAVAALSTQMQKNIGM